MAKLVMPRICPRCGKPLKYACSKRGFLCVNPNCEVHRVKYNPRTFDIIEILETAIAGEIQR